MTALAALQDALAIEHQVIYGYGVVGAHLGGRDRLATPAQALQRLQEHQELRDRIAALVRVVGVTPTAAEAAYQLPFPVTSASSACRLAQRLESSVAAAAYNVIVASHAGTPARRLMVPELSVAAEWDARWALADFSAYITPFPGRPTQAT